MVKYLLLITFVFQFSFAYADDDESTGNESNEVVTPKSSKGPLGNVPKSTLAILAASGASVTIILLGYQGVKCIAKNVKEKKLFKELGLEVKKAGSLFSTVYETTDGRQYAIKGHPLGSKKKLGLMAVTSL